MANEMITNHNAARAAGNYIKSIEPYPGRFRGRGVVICAGGVKYLTSAWVLIKMLRRLECELPIQVWHLGETECDKDWTELVEPLGAECVDAELVCRRHPHPRLGGWELKPYSILHSPFKEVLFLDADNVPVRDPTYLFEEARYRHAGAVFWPDGLRTPPQSERWGVFGVAYRDEWEQESGQILIDKEACWAPLNLCNWYNEHSDFFYRIVYGDKDTFRFAWHRLQQPYAMPERGLMGIPYTLCQHDFQGHRLFQHRCAAKWTLGRNRRSRGFRLEDECLQLVRELKGLWNPMPLLTKHLPPSDRQQMAELLGRRFDVVGASFRKVFLLSENSLIIEGREDAAYYWWMEKGSLVIASPYGRPTLRLTPQPDGTWTGRGVHKPQVVVRLAATTK